MTIFKSESIGFSCEEQASSPRKEGEEEVEE